MHRLVVALVTLIGLAGAAVVGSYLFLFSAATDRAAALVPASTAVYANIYLQPSTGQQMNLAGLIGRLPGFADEATLDDKVDQIVENLLSGTGVDYRTQIKPWLGDQVAFAAWPSAEDPAQAEMVVLAEVKDQDAAETSVAELVSGDGAAPTVETYGGVELGVGTGGAYMFVGDMLAIGATSDGLHAIVDVSGGDASLAGRSDFREAMAQLPADHLASVFVDMAAIATATGVDAQLGNVTTASATLVAERDGLRLSGSAPFDLGTAPPSARDGFALGTEPSSLVEWMPQETLAEAVVFGLRQTLEDAEAALRASGAAGDVTSTLDTVRAIVAFGLGLDLDADVLPLLDREVGIAITGFDGSLPAGQLLLRPDDAAAAADAIGRIADRLEALGSDRRSQDHEGVEITTLSLPDFGDVAYAIADGIVIIGLSADDVVAGLDAHATGTSVAHAAAYQRAFDVAGARAGTEAFVDVGAVVDLAGDALTLPADARDILGQVGAFGLTLPSHDDQIEFHAVLTVDEPGSAAR